MPIYQHKIINKNVKLGIWFINEPIQQLTKLAEEKKVNLTNLPQVKNESRVKQWLATRLLLNYFFADVTIVYDEKGKPYLNNGWNISISHSGDYVAIILNKNGLL